MSAGVKSLQTSSSSSRPLCWSSQKESKHNVSHYKTLCLEGVLQKSDCVSICHDAVPHHTVFRRSSESFRNSGIFSTPQQPSGPLFWFMQDGGRLCVVVVPRGGEKQVARRLKNWWMMINSCERVKLIQTVWHNKWGTTLFTGFSKIAPVTWQWAGIGQDSLGFCHQSRVQTGSKTRCHTGLRVWPLLSWRWCTALSNLFITPRFLLYVSSIFHDRGVNHQQHPVFFSHERMNMLVYLCHRPESQLTQWERERQRVTIPNTTYVLYSISSSGMGETFRTSLREVFEELVQAWGQNSFLCFVFILRPEV